MLDTLARNQHITSQPNTGHSEYEIGGEQKRMKIFLFRSRATLPLTSEQRVCARAPRTLCKILEFMFVVATAKTSYLTSIEEWKREDRHRVHQVHEL